MKNKKVLIIVGVVLLILGISVCFGVAVFGSADVEVRIERAGVCNPLKPVKDKEVKTNKDTKKRLVKFWKKTDKEKQPDSNKLVDSLIGDYKLFVGDDEILFNLDVSYVSYNGKYVDISDEFMEYLSDYVKNNDSKLKEAEEKTKDPVPSNGEECCSCCPDLKPGETCIDLCCECD